MAGALRNTGEAIAEWAEDMDATHFITLTADRPRRRRELRV